MDEFEFCLKSISYFFGMFFEGKECKVGDVVRVLSKVIIFLKVLFVVFCYLIGLVLFDLLELVDKKRLVEDYDGLEVFKKKFFVLKFGESLKLYFINLGFFIFLFERFFFDWFEF